MKSHPYKTLIVDDEEHCRSALQRAISRYCPELEVLDSVHSVADARVSIARQQPDLIFLDVEMPEEDGFDLLEQLGSKRIPVIFTTAFEHYALPALRKRAVDYLLKPVDPRELIAAVNKLDTTESPPKLHESHGKVALPTLNGMVFSHSHEIIRCQADGAYTRIFGNKDSVLVSRNIGQIEKMLAHHGFFRIHKSHLINLHHVQEYIRGKGGIVVMDDGSHVEVSKRKREDFLLAIST